MLPERLMAMLSGFFGALAALLAIGRPIRSHFLLSGARQNEIGIRLALGARRGQVVGLVMREAGWIARGRRRDRQSVSR